MRLGENNKVFNILVSEAIIGTVYYDVQGGSIFFLLKSVDETQEWPFKLSSTFMWCGSFFNYFRQNSSNLYSVLTPQVVQS